MRVGKRSEADTTPGVGNGLCPNGRPEQVILQEGHYLKPLHSTCHEVYPRESFGEVLNTTKKYFDGKTLAAARHSHLPCPFPLGTWSAGPECYQGHGDKMAGCGRVSFGGRPARSTEISAQL